MSSHAGPSTASTSSSAPSPPPNDLQTLRRIKANISSGQHPDYTAIIKPQALKQVSVSAQEAIDQNDKALSVKPRIIHRARPQPFAASTSATSTANPGFFRDDSTALGAKKMEPAEAAPTLDVEAPTMTIVPSNDDDRPASTTPLTMKDSSTDAASTTIDPVRGLPILDIPLPESSAIVDDPPAASPAADRAASTGPTPPPDSILSEPQDDMHTAEPVSSPTVRPSTPTVIETEADVPSELPLPPSLPEQAPLVPVDSTSPEQSGSTGPSATLALPSVIPASDSAHPTLPEGPTTEDRLTRPSPTRSDAPPLPQPSSVNAAAGSAESGDMDVDGAPPTDEKDVQTRADDFKREREEADERERLRVERRAQEKAVEKTRYAEREREKQAYRAKLREERERETQIEVQKYREERERERLARERPQAPAPPARPRGYDQFGR